MQVEKDLLTDFVHHHPYPAYDSLLLMIENNLQLWAEYGIANHLFCKEIYENPHNKELIIERGQRIYKMGGMRALVHNYTVLKFLTPYWKCPIDSIQRQSLRIGEYFQEQFPSFNP
jgi:hypothetical protein